jgi:hypothetical protein
MVKDGVFMVPRNNERLFYLKFVLFFLIEV